MIHTAPTSCVPPRACGRGRHRRPYRRPRGYLFVGRQSALGRQDLFSAVQQDSRTWSTEAKPAKGNKKKRYIVYYKGGLHEPDARTGSFGKRFSKVCTTTLYVCTRASLPWPGAKEKCYTIVHSALLGLVGARESCGFLATGIASSLVYVGFVFESARVVAQKEQRNGCLAERTLVPHPGGVVQALYTVRVFVNAAVSAWALCCRMTGLFVTVDCKQTQTRAIMFTTKTVGLAAATSLLLVSPSAAFAPSHGLASLAAPASARLCPTTQSNRLQARPALLSLRAKIEPRLVDSRLGWVGRYVSHTLLSTLSYENKKELHR